jgi:hypothetical protein
MPRDARPRPARDRPETGQASLRRSGVADGYSRWMVLPSDAVQEKLIHQCKDFLR